MKIKFGFIFLFMFLSLFIFGKSYAQAPVIEEITPNRAYVSDEVVIKGKNFGSSGNFVFFRTVRARIKSQSPTEIRVIVPENAKVGNVSVETNGQKSNDYKFYVLPYVEFKLASSNIELGKETQGILTVFGSKIPWKILVINKYYETVRLDNGEKQKIVMTSGGDNNTAKVGITAIKKGNFNISFRVLSGDKNYRNPSSESKDSNQQNVNENKKSDLDDQKSKLEAEEKAKLEAEEKAKAEAEKQAKEEAKQKAKLEAEEKAKLEAEERAKQKAEEKAKAEAEKQAKAEAKQKAKLEAEEKAK